MPEVYDILASSLSFSPYVTLKAAILERTRLSERKRMRDLLSLEELADRRLSHLLRHMQTLLDDRAVSSDADILKELSLQRLPPAAQMIRTTTNFSLPTLAGKDTTRSWR